MAQAITTIDQPIPMPAKQQRRGKRTQSLASLADAQTSAAVEEVRQIVTDGASIQVELYAAVPKLIKAEVEQQLQARLPLIEKENADSIAQASDDIREVVASSRKLANEFLASYGLGEV